MNIFSDDNLVGSHAYQHVATSCWFERNDVATLRNTWRRVYPSSEDRTVTEVRIVCPACSHSYESLIAADDYPGITWPP